MFWLTAAHLSPHPFCSFYYWNPLESDSQRMFIVACDRDIKQYTLFIYEWTHMSRDAGFVMM